MEENSVELLSRILDEAKEEVNFKNKKPPKKKKSKLWVVFLAISIFLLVDCVFILYSEGTRNIELQEKIESLEYDNRILQTRIEAKARAYQEIKNELNIVKEEYSNTQWELNFWEENAVLVTESGGKYHRKDCQYVKDRTFWIYNVENAIYKGYSPCSVCDPPTR